MRKRKHSSDRPTIAATAPEKAAGNTPANLRAPQRKRRCERRRNAVAAKSLDIPPHMQTAASLPEETLHPLEDILVLDRFGMLETGLLRQLFDQPLLFGTELRGDRDVDHD